MSSTCTVYIYIKLLPWHYRNIKELNLSTVYMNYKFKIAEKLLKAISIWWINFYKTASFVRWNCSKAQIVTRRVLKKGFWRFQGGLFNTCLFQKHILKLKNPASVQNYRFFYESRVLQGKDVIFPKISILDVWQVSEYPFVLYILYFWIKNKLLRKGLPKIVKNMCFTISSYFTTFGQILRVYALQPMQSHIHS